MRRAYFIVLLLSTSTLLGEEIAVENPYGADSVAVEGGVVASSHTSAIATEPSPCQNCLTWCQTSYQANASMLDSCVRGCSANYTSCSASATAVENPNPYATAPVAPFAPATPAPFPPDIAQPQISVTATAAGTANYVTEAAAASTSTAEPDAKSCLRDLAYAKADLHRFGNEKTDLQFKLMLAYSQDDKKQIQSTQKDIEQTNQKMLRQEARISSLESKLSSMGIPYANTPAWNTAPAISNSGHLRRYRH